MPLQTKDESSMLRLITLATLGVSVLTVVFIARGPGNLAASAGNRTCSGEFAACVKMENAREYCKVCSNGGGGAHVAESCRECTDGKQRCENASDACAGKE